MVSRRRLILQNQQGLGSYKEPNDNSCIVFEYKVSSKSLNFTEVN